MAKYYLVLLTLSHVLGDFYFQNENLAQEKRKHLKWVLLHGFFYWLVGLGVTSLVMSREVFIYGAISAFLHLLIDILKYLLLRKKGEEADAKTRNVFFIDQIAHFVSMLVIVSVFGSRGYVLEFSPLISRIFGDVGFTVETFRYLSLWAMILSILHKPANLAISLVLKPYKPAAKDNAPDDKNAGRLIGTLERMIMIAMIYLGQYSAIGLVLTAKSIARYDKISKDPGFAEYYLLGTLLSTLAVISLSLIVKELGLAF